MRRIIENAISEHEKAVTFLKENVTSVEDIARVVVDSLINNGKVLLAGNGGSAADAQHIAAELVGRFKKNRAPLAAAALTTDTSVLTAIANDFGYDEVFGIQVRAVGKKNDVLIAISTSGNSQNLIEAVKAARSIGMKTVGLLGRDGGKIKEIVDVALIIPFETATVQEIHGMVGHMVSEIVEEKLFPSQ